MGSSARSLPAVTDIDRPADWGGIQGHVAVDDTAVLAADHLRIYLSGTGAPASIAQQATMLAPLAGPLRQAADLPALSDVTQMAARLGITPQDLSRARSGGAKTTQPNSLLAIGAGTDTPAVVLLRRAKDAPNAPVNATLYCFQTSDAGTVSILHLGPVAPGLMIEIKAQICALDHN